MPEAKKKPRTVKVCQDTLTTLESACKNLTVENAKLREDVDLWQQQARQAERDHRNVDRHFQEEKADHGRLLESRRILQQGFEEVQKRVAMSDATRTQSKALLDAEKQALDAERVQDQQKTYELEDVAQQLEQRSKLAAQFAGQGFQERQKLQDELASLRAERNAISSDFAVSVEMRRELAHRLQSLEQQALDAQRALSGRKQHIASESQALHQTVEMLKADVAAVKGQKEKELGSLQAQVTEAHETDQERAELVKSALQELNDSQRIMKQWEERVNALTAQCGSAKDQRRSAELARAAQEKSREGVERELSRTQAEAKRLEALKATLEDQTRYLEVSHLGLKEAYSWLVLESAGVEAKRLLEDLPASEVSVQPDQGIQPQNVSSQGFIHSKSGSPLRQQISGLGPAGRRTPSSKSSSLESATGRERGFTFSRS